MEQSWLKCSASLGQFPTEMAVAGTQSNGHSFSLFAPKEYVAGVQADETGYLKVDVVDRWGDLALVRLHAQTFETGQYVTVKVTDLHPISGYMLSTGAKVG
jgi:hypothetical protein